MKRYHSRLETVLRVRRTHLDLARSDLARAAASVRAAELAAAASAAHCSQLATEAPDDRGVEALLALRQRLDLSARAAAVAVAALERAVDEQSEARIRYLSASARVSVLEGLEERRRADHAATAARQDLAAVDDLVTARYVRDHAR